MSDAQESRPFLPEPDPPHVPARARGLRTLVLWAVLIVMFFAIWQILQPGPGATPTHVHVVQGPPPDDSGPTWSSVLTTLVPMVFLGLFFVVFIRRHRVVATFNLSQEPGLLALAERRFSEATALFRASVAQSKQPACAAVASYNLATTQIWAGELDDAIITLSGIERARGVALGPRSSGLRLRAAQDLVLVYGLKGDLDTAQRWADDARARLSASNDERVYAASALCLGEAVIALRRGKPGDARALLEKSWLPLRATLNANMMRVAEILRAFAELDGGLREYNTVQERVIRVQPVSGSEFAFLGVSWPEMQTFLVAHRLVPTRADT